MPTQSGPHDAVFRRILGEPVNAASQLRAVLPGAMVNRFLLDDLTRLDEQALRARPLTPPVRMTLLLLKIAAGNARLAEDLRKWSDDLRAILVRPGGVEEFVALLRYIELVGEAPTDRLHNLIATLGPEAEEAYVTTAEMLRAEGEARGVARGRAEGEACGVARGRAEGEAKAVLRVLEMRGVMVSNADRERIAACTDLDRLETWLSRALTATTIHDLDD